MRQLTSLDAQFLALESARQTGHVGGLAILDPSTAPGGTITGADIQHLLAERLPALPPFRWKLAEVPLGLDFPYWIEDPDFDLNFHVREIALPPKGTHDHLSEQVSRIMGRPLDRSRPLWELYLVHGLEKGFSAVLTKIHHAVIDGMSGAEIMGLLLDLSPEGRPPPDPVKVPDVEEGEPGQIEMLARGLLGVPRYPVRLLRSLPTTIPNIDEVPAIFGGIPGAGTVGRIASRVQGVVSDGTARGRNTLQAPKTKFNGRISPHRRFAFGRLSLDEVKAVKKAHGVTVNDVVVSICAGAVRRWLERHDDLPDEPLVAQIPVSVRTDEQVGTYGNRIMLMSAPLFTDEPDPVKRLEETHGAMVDMKERHKALPASLLQGANELIPPAVFSRAAQLTFRLSTSRPGRPAWNLVISNVPGPQFPLYLAGAKLVANYPVSVITDGMGLNITVMSYNGHCDFGIVADRDLMPDVHELIGWLQEELDALKKPEPPKKRAKRAARSPGRR